MDKSREGCRSAEALEHLGQDEGQPPSATRGAVIVGGHAPSVSLDDSAGYEQAHAHAAILGGKEALENAV
jgi:hypothetical protein